MSIGTTSPNQKLHIKGNDDEYAVLEFEGRRSSGTRKDRSIYWSRCYWRKIGERIMYLNLETLLTKQ